MDNKKREVIKIATTVIIYTIFTLIIWKIIQGYLTTDFFSSILSKTGILAPVIMIFLQALQVLIAPIPVQPVSIASGYIFGALWGFIIAYIGLVIGSFIAFYIGKVFGRPLVKKIVSKKVMNKYDGYIQNTSVFILALIMWLPLFPDDEILYILGMSKTKVKKIIIPILIGKTGGASTAIISAGLGKYSPFTFHIIFFVLLMTVMGFYYRTKLEKWFEKLIKKLKMKDIKVSAIIINQKGEILLQKREKNPEINKWVLFGGSIEKGESEIEALEREMLEELEYKIKNPFFFKKYYYKDVEQPIYIIKDDIDINDLKLHEGSDMKFFSPTDLENIEIGFNYREILEDYLKK